MKPVSNKLQGVWLLFYVIKQSLYPAFFNMKTIKEKTSSNKVKITYLDPRGINNKSFDSVEEMKKYKPRKIESIGYLNKETDKYYYISQILNGTTPAKHEAIQKSHVINIEYDPKEGIEILTEDVQYMIAEMPIEKLLTKPLPLTRYYGFQAYKDEENIAIALNRNEDGNFRSYSIIPIAFLMI